MTNDVDKEVRCSFCNRTSEELPDVLFISQEYKGDVIYVCEECIAAMNHTIQSSREEEELTDELRTQIEKVVQHIDESVPKPKQIKSYLDQHIIGQDDAKKTISIAAYNHYKYLEYYDEHKDDNEDHVELQRSNILILGPSGVGKTETIRALSKFMKVPLAICDCSGLSSVGYVGADPVSVLTNLLFEAGGDVEQAQRGIVYLDEFDKLAKRSADNKSRDITGEGVQMELLKLVEGTVMDVPLASGGMRKGMSETVRMDTSHILFICGGAFSGIEDIIQERLESESSLPSMGFGNTISKEQENQQYNDLISKVTTEDLLDYGIISEMLGRLPIVCSMKELTQDEMTKILTEPKNAIVKQYQELFKCNNADLHFDDDALSSIANEAIERKIGARGLRSILEQILRSSMYEVPDKKGKKKVIVTKDCVVNHVDPEIKIVRRKKKTTDIDTEEKVDDSSNIIIQDIQ